MRTHTVLSERQTRGGAHLADKASCCVFTTVCVDTTKDRCRPCRNMATEEPDVNQSQCVCKPASENFGRLLRWHPEMVTKVRDHVSAAHSPIVERTVAKSGAHSGYSQVQNNTCVLCDASIFPLDNVVCPGGPKPEQHLHAKPGWWMASLEWPQEKLMLSKANHKMLDNESDERSLNEVWPVEHAPLHAHLCVCFGNFNDFLGQYVWCHR